MDLANETVTFGTYPAASKTAIQTMLGVPSADDVVTDVQVNGTSVVNNGVVNLPVASASEFGMVKVSGAMGVDILNGFLTMSSATSYYIQDGTHARKAITPQYQHESVFYGLSKAAGVNLKDEEVTVGTYPEASKAAIKSMLGVNVDDVTVNGDSVVSNGVANIPLGGTETLGVVKITGGSSGIWIDNQGYISVMRASAAEVKAGTSAQAPIVPKSQHQAIFYGLAKAAGDTTQSASSNAVGSYTDSAKASIKSMLGIGDRLSDIEVEVTGTTPTITANSSTRYICGEVTEVTFTPPASGTTELIFTSGSTVPTLTLPSTVLMPEWFVIEPNRIYQISIENNRYGAVASWPVA